MIKIGNFARLGQVSVATLRFYDEVDLLKPVKVDTLTGYRFYAADQLPTLNRILALKDFGFSLDQIRLMLVNGLSADQLRNMLTVQRAEVEKRLSEEQARLARIEARLRQITLEDKMPKYDVVVKTAPAMWIASCRVTIPTNDQVPAYLDPAYGKVYAYLHEQGVRPRGVNLTIWHQPAEVLANEDAEAMVEIDHALPGTADVKVYELPATRVASVVHHGDFSEFGQGHAVLLEWIDANGYQIVGPYRELYIKHDKANLSESTTEIQYPVEKV